MRKILGIILAVVLLACNLPFAWAEEINIEQEYGSDETPVINDYILVGDQRWELDSVSSPYPAQDQPQMTFIREVTQTVTPERYNAGDLAALFSDDLPIDQNGYQGSVGLADVNAQPVYRVSENQVERAVDFTGLTSNDVNIIPSTFTFEVPTADGVSTTGPVEFERLSVEFELISSGREASYTAHVIYRGVEDNVVLTSYAVTARYEGQISQENGVMAVTATYTSPAATISDESLPLGNAPIPMINILVAAIAVVLVAIFLLALIWLLRKNALLKDESTRRVLKRRRLKVVAGRAEFVIPDKIDIYAGELEIVCKPSLASQNGDLYVTWRGKSYDAGPLAPCVDFMAEVYTVQGIEQYVTQDEISGHLIDTLGLKA